jgi:vacuolar-type H+-ATPase subunit H
MTADEARHTAEQALKDAEEQRWKNREQELARIKKHEQELLEALPQRLEKARAQIKQAASNGVRAVVITDNDGAAVLLEAVRQALVADGYTVGHVRRHSEDSNMGDFNAPCTVTHCWVEMQVSW